MNILSFTQNPVAKAVVTWAVLPLIIVALVVLNVENIMKPVKFNKEKEFREQVAIQRLKDIRTLQDAYKSVHAEYTFSMDSLVKFYNEENIVVKMQIGSKDDSLTYAHTKKVLENVPNLKGEDADKYLYELYKKGDKNLAFAIAQNIPARDTLFNDRAGFCVDSLRTIPFSGGRKVKMDAVTKMVSGVKVPLFEAKMPYRYLLAGMDNQLRINLDDERRNSNHYEGLQVGSISAPNNNAGNWE